MKTVKQEIKFNSLYEPSSDELNFYKDKFNKLAENIRFIGFNPQAKNHFAFDYYVFDKQDFA